VTIGTQRSQSVGCSRLSPTCSLRVQQRSHFSPRARSTPARVQGDEAVRLLAAKAARYDTPTTSIQGKEQRTMKQVNRRSALSVGLAAMAAFVAAASAYAQRQLPPGISLQAWGKRESMIPGYKTVSMRDLVYQPGAKTSNPSMPNDMVCHVPEGELRVKQSDGMEFVAKKGDVWTCKKGIGEDLENVGSTVAIMRIVDLLPE